MPRRQPFTQLCQLAAFVANPSCADLHVHTAASDGAFTPSQVVAFAARAGLKAVAITDHDTLAGWREAEQSIQANGFAVEFVPGIEISTFQGTRDWHLLAYGLRETDAVRAMIATLQEARRSRFRKFVEGIRERGQSLPDFAIESLLASETSLGRRHLATLLVDSGAVRSRYEAFRQFLLPLGPSVERLRTIAFAEALAIVHSAGGFASLAHPPEEATLETLTEFRDLGLDAVEVEFPAASRGRSIRLREWAVALGIGCTGGSDCHGAERRVGGRTIPMRDLDGLRRLTRR